MADLRAVQAKLQAIRTRTDLSLKPTPLMRESFVGLDKVERPLALRYYQAQMVLHLLIMKRFVVGDDTGLGKTFETIAALCYLWQRDPNLKAVVFTKKSAVRQWNGEFAKFTRGVTIHTHVGTPKKRAKVREQFLAGDGPQVLITGYRSMVRDFSKVQDWEIDVLVFDEATMFKTPDTQVAQVCGHLSYHAHRVWGLTATLIKNNLLEGWGVYRVIVPGLFQGSKNTFMNDYCIVHMQPIGRGRRVPQIVGYRRRDIDRFKEYIDPFYLGRPKHEVADELPVLTTRTLEVGMTQFQHQKYQEALAGLLELGSGEEKETTKLTALIYCQEVVNHLGLLEFDDQPSEKLDALTELVTEGGEFHKVKTIVFTRFSTMVDIAQEHLAKKKIKSVRVTGKENEDAREAAKLAFQDPDSGVDVIFITMAGGDAINLQAAQVLVFYDTPWSAGDYLQILGRMIRIGSLHDRVYAVHLVVRRSIDARTFEKMSRKMVLVEAVIGKRLKGEDDGSETIESRGDVTELFEAMQSDARQQLLSVR